MCETNIRKWESRESQEDFLGRVILMCFNWHNNASTPGSFNLEVSLNADEGELPDQCTALRELV